MIILSLPSTKQNCFSYVWLPHICIAKYDFCSGCQYVSQQQLLSVLFKTTLYMYPHADDHTIWTTFAFINIYLALKSPGHLSHALL